MKIFANTIEQVKGFCDLLDAVRSSDLPAAVSGLGEVHKAHLIAGMAGKLGRAAAVIASSEAEAARLAGDLAAMGRHVKTYPQRDFSFHPLEGRSREFEQQRLEVLAGLLNGSCDTVIMTAEAAMQLTIPASQLSSKLIRLSEGGPSQAPHVMGGLPGIVTSLLSSGYQRCDQVEGTGQFSVRGGILDIFPPGSLSPARVEFWGDEVDTIARFDPESQRRGERISRLDIFPAAELAVDDPVALAEKISELAASLKGSGSAAARERLLREADAIRGGLNPASADKYLPLLCDEEATVLDYLPADALLFVSEYAAVRERMSGCSGRLLEEIKSLLEDGALCKGLTRFAKTPAELTAIFAEKAIFIDIFPMSSVNVPLKKLIDVKARQLPNTCSASVGDGTVAALAEDIESMTASGSGVAVMAGSARSADALARDLTEAGFIAIRDNDPERLVPGSVIVTESGLSAGFEYPGAGIAVMSWGRTRESGQASVTLQTAKKRRRSSEIQSLSELSQGDYVVHVTHGIGLFGGIVKIESDGLTRDYIKITYDKGDILYVPVTQLDLVGKYIGAKEDGAVRLSKLGGSDWSNRKQKARKAVKDIAEQLIKLYAARMQAEGYPFDPDAEWQHDFESKFEYEETPDQLICVGEIKNDMERGIPMDRLLCGDVGFGKTEVAFRAAFKCAAEGRQCALLAPTTILAWQHYQTALRRFEGFGVRVEMLSRFRTPKQRAEIVRELKRGAVDFLIGTHSIIQKDVEFRDLGLAIIDEEQRFGVAHKERFKEAYPAVDILTLSATPIPRTLNLALSGLRDISSLEEPPRDRHPVQTFVMEYDHAIVAEAIRRELRRGGQVFYLHNRVASIESAAARIHDMAPDASVGIAHGQMSEEQISREWKRMLDHEIDILVCTTIIESGIDVPNANTLIVENADRFGLSQLHQIRGRVGRSSRRAYAYFTFKKNREITEIAQKRLSAIREFTEFGSGMKIALRDLELRGAGNILGGEQSGQLQSVGYDLYLKLLNEAVAAEKGETPPPVDAECTVDLQIEAHIPEDYIEALALRLDVYRLIADIRSAEDASDVIDELCDRFGEPPGAVIGLIKAAELRNKAAGCGVTEIKQGGGKALLYLKEVDFERVSRLISAMRGRVMLSAGQKPYLTVKPDKGQSVFDAACEAVELYSG